MNWQAFEEQVKNIYSVLLNMKDEGILVSRNTTLFSNSGIPHQIDVYYEFKKADLVHKVAIECKNTQRPVDKGKVQEFESKIRDLNNVIGVMVSANGYQDNAKKFADQKGLIALEFSQLPTMVSLIGKRIKTVALPDETYIGEPFWTIMEVRNGETTGTYFTNNHPGVNKHLIPLVYSEIYAQQIMKQAQLNPKQWAVRGLPLYSLRAFILMLELAEMNRQGAMIGLKPPQSDESEPFIWIPITREELIQYYYGKPIPLIAENNS